MLLVLTVMLISLVSHQMGWKQRKQVGKYHYLRTYVRGTYLWWAYLWAAACLCPGVLAQMAPCSFNFMCSCRYTTDSGQPLTTTAVAVMAARQSLPEHINEVTCVGVPFARIPGQYLLHRSPQVPGLSHFLRSCKVTGHFLLHRSCEVSK